MHLPVQFITKGISVSILNLFSLVKIIKLKFEYVQALDYICGFIGLRLLRWACVQIRKNVKKREHYKVHNAVVSHKLVTITNRKSSRDGI